MYLPLKRGTYVYYYHAISYLQKFIHFKLYEYKLAVHFGIIATVSIGVMFDEVLSPLFLIEHMSLTSVRHSVSLYFQIKWSLKLKDELHEAIHVQINFGGDNGYLLENGDQYQCSLSLSPFFFFLHPSMYPNLNR